MPIFEKGDRKIFFIHIPKTGGTSVIHLLENAGWQLREDTQPHHPDRNVWETWEENWDSEFCLSRNPYSRFLSQIRYTIPARPGSTASPTYLMKLSSKVLNDLIPSHGTRASENHYLPQIDFISSETHWFRLEDQKKDFLQYLYDRDIISNKIFTRQYAEKEDIPRENVTNVIPVNVSWRSHQDIHRAFLDLYSCDFKMFGYNIDKE